MQMKQIADGMRQGPPKDGPPKPPPGGGEPGLMIPPFVRDKIKFQGKQEQQLDELEKDTRAKLDKILTEEQRKQLPELFRKGPMGGPPDGKDKQPPPKQGDPKKPNFDEAKTTDGIQWFPTLTVGLEQAASTGRPILLVSGAPHCSGVSGVW
jgi:hypothetical protein